MSKNPADKVQRALAKESKQDAKGVRDGVAKASTRALRTHGVPVRKVHAQKPLEPVDAIKAAVPKKT